MSDSGARKKASYPDDETKVVTGLIWGGLAEKWDGIITINATVQKVFEFWTCPRFLIIERKYNIKDLFCRGASEWALRGNKCSAYLFSFTAVWRLRNSRGNNPNFA